MKKIILLGLMTITAIVSQAQKLEIIPKVGISVATQNIQGLSGEKMKVGFQGGVGINVLTNVKNFSIQPEINYVSKGTKINGSVGKTDFNLSYLELPILAKYSFGLAYVNAGPSIGLLMDKNSKITQKYGSKLNRIDFGVQMGAGVAIPAGLGKVVVDGRYALGINDLSKKGSVKNRGIMASIGFAIPLK